MQLHRVREGGKMQDRSWNNLEHSPVTLGYVNTDIDSMMNSLCSEKVLTEKAFKQVEDFCGEAFQLQQRQLV